MENAGALHSNRFVSDGAVTIATMFTCEIDEWLVGIDDREHDVKMYLSWGTDAVMSEVGYLKERVRSLTPEFLEGREITYLIIGVQGMLRRRTERFLMWSDGDTLEDNVLRVMESLENEFNTLYHEEFVSL